MTLKKDMQKAFGIEKENRMLKVAVERLHPPKPIVSEIGLSRYAENHIESGEQDSPTNSKLAIDFSYLTNNSSFQRAIIEFIRKYIPGFENVNPRGSKDVMTKSFNKNISNYREVMAELKLKLQEKRVEEP